MLALLRAGKYLGLRAGAGPHRFIGIWVVVVDDRVFVRSWNDRPQGWRRAFLADPSGTIKIGEREVQVRARATRSERLRAAVDRAYREKYDSPGALVWVRGLVRGRRRLTTMELVPR